MALPNNASGRDRKSAPEQHPEAGKSYWMAFSNSGTLFKRGDRVDIVIGISTRPNYWSKSILG